MKLKRILAALLTAAALLSLALPAAASGGSFSDINDHSTAVNVDVLRLMGAVSGDSDGTFRPNDVLTRAQFCTMLGWTAAAAVQGAPCTPPAPSFPM